MAEMHWQIWAGGQELWETPKHWSWSGPCTTLKERAHFCTGRHAEGDRCRCACGMERPVMTGGAPPKPPPTAMSWPRQNGKTVISEHINALQARVAELEGLLADCDASNERMAKALERLNAERDKLRLQLGMIQDVCQEHEGCGDECSAVEEILAIYGGGE